MIDNLHNILVLAPHTDDGELGCGGTIARLVERGHRVTYVAFSTADQSLPKGFPPGALKDELSQAIKKLGVSTADQIVFDYEVRKLNYVRQEILEDLVRIKRDIPVDLVLMPSLKDIHQDHSTVAMEGLRAFKDRTILGYELIWNNLSFDTDCFVKLEERHVLCKIEALACYKSQAGKAYAAADFIRALARARGVQIGSEFAESFEVVRLVV